MILKMDITKQNFKELLPLIKDTISKADFVAIDGEFTGLCGDGGQKYNDLDTSEERYLKARYNVTKFAIIQYGVCTFRYDKATNKYLTATFCFYLLGKDGMELTADPSSLNFLANNGFDFNKLYKDGLSYVSMDDEVKLRENLARQQSFQNNSSPVKITDDASKKFYKDATARVQKFLKNSSADPLIFSGSATNGFLRRILYSNIAEKYPNIMLKQLPGYNRDIEVLKFNSKDEVDEHRAQLEEQKIQDKVCFTKVIQHILEEDKPIVGHNILLDLLHTYHKFVHSLPETYENFQVGIKSNFPTIYDTKILARDPPFVTDISNNALNLLYSRLVGGYNPPNFEIEQGCESYLLENESNAHNAGYDAFITGVSFVTMAKTLIGQNWQKESIIKSEKLKHYENRIHIMYSYDIPYLDIVGPGLPLDRRHIFEVRCPSNWSFWNLKSLFNIVEPYKTTWVNDNHVYVIPQEFEDIEKIAPAILPKIQASCPPNVYVNMYNSTSNNVMTVESKYKIPTSTKTVEKRKIASSERESSPTSGNPRDLKRLKSVGSDKLSQLTLESPTQDKQLIETVVKSIKNVVSGEKTRKVSNDFAEPEEW